MASSPRDETPQPPDRGPTVLVMPSAPTSRAQGRRRGVNGISWRIFLHDLSYLLPLFGIVLGLLLIRGQAPSWGGIILIIGLYLAGLRFYSGIESRRVRRKIAPLRHWMRLGPEDPHSPARRRR
jgi:hypothetical protein